MNFKEKLDDLLKRDRFIEDEWHYTLIQLSKMFFEGNRIENLDALLTWIDRNMGNDWIWSFIRFLDVIVSKNEDIRSWEEERRKIEIWLERHLLEQDKIPQTPLLKILDVLFGLKTTPKKEIELLRPIVRDSSEYQILQSILLQISNDKQCDKLFREVLLKSLVVDRWNYIGIGYISRLYSRIGSSGELINFLVNLQKPKFEKAVREFFAMTNESADAFLKSIKNKKTEIIYEIGSIFSKLWWGWIWYGDNSHYVQDFLKKFLFFINQEKISLFEEQNWIFQEGIFWNIYEIIAPFITFDDIEKYYTEIDSDSIHIIRLYELIKNTNPGRNDKDKILKKIYKLNGFKKHYENCLKLWEEESKKHEKNIEKYKQQEKEEIKKMIEGIEKDKLMVPLIDKFYKKPELFEKKEIQKVKWEVVKFLEWNLFNFETPVYVEDTNEDGTKSFRGWFWYQIEFFENTLDLWKNKFHWDIKRYREKIIRSLLLVNTGKIKNIWKMLWESTKLNDKEVDMILSALQKNHISKVRYHLSGQNIFDVLELFKTSLQNKKFKKKTRDILWGILQDENYSDFRRVEAISWARENSFLDTELLEKTKKYWESLLDKDKNYIESFAGENLIFGINRVLIETQDKDAIIWRVEQLKTAKIYLSEQDIEKAQGGIANEIRWERYLFRALKTKITHEYQSSMIEVLKHAIDLLNEDGINSPKTLTKYAEYLLHNLFEIFKNLNKKDIFHQVRLIRWELQGYAGYIFGFYYRNFQAQFISELNEQEQKTLIYELVGEIEDTENRAQHNSQEWLNRKITLFVEWITDKRHLENAWQYRRNWLQQQFIIQNGYCASHVQQIAIRWELDGIEIWIFLFDFDREWLEHWNSLQKNTWELKDSNTNSCLTLNQKKDRKWALLLPTFTEIKDQVICDTDYLEWSRINIKKWFFWFNSHFPIELLFLNTGWIKIKNKFFKKSESHNSWYYWEFKWVKEQFPENIIKVFKENNPTKNLRVLYENFEPLLQKIEDIIKESKNN